MGFETGALLSTSTGGCPVRSGCSAEALPVQINHRAQTPMHCPCCERTRQIGVDTSQQVETNHRQASHTLTSHLDPMLVLRTESAPLSFEDSYMVHYCASGISCAFPVHREAEIRGRIRLNRGMIPPRFYAPEEQWIS